MSPRDDWHMKVCHYPADCLVGPECFHEGPTYFHTGKAGAYRWELQKHRKPGYQWTLVALFREPSC